MDFFSVTDSRGFYKTFVRKDESGAPMYYALGEGESCINALPPLFRSTASGAGYVHPVWDPTAQEWTEGASPEEIAAFEAEHPDLEAKASMEKRVQNLEMETTAISAAIERGLSL